MNRVAEHLREPEETFAGIRECPEYEGSRRACKAATSFLVPSRRQQMRYCKTCDYDNCPIYLGKALRSSCSQGLARDSLVDSGK